MQPSPEELNRRILEGLDFLLVELAKRDLTVVLVLNNFMPWSGGMAQYVAWASQTSIPYAGEMGLENWEPSFQYTAVLPARRRDGASYTVAEAVVRRHNSLSGVAYADDPTIMAWELAQMPRAMRVQHEYRNWVRRFSRRIKNWDANHLITLGSEGNTPFPEYVGNSFTADHSPDEIDYSTVHIWPQDWRWYDPDGASTSSVLRAVTKAKAYLLDHVDAAEKMRQPLVLEEFGVARDESAERGGTPTDRRDEWFMAVCNEVAARTPSPYSAALRSCHRAFVGARTNERGSWSRRGQPLVMGGRGAAARPPMVGRRRPTHRRPSARGAGQVRNLRRRRFHAQKDPGAGGVLLVCSYGYGSNQPNQIVERDTSHLAVGKASTPGHYA